MGERSEPGFFVLTTPTLANTPTKLIVHVMLTIAVHSIYHMVISCRVVLTMKKFLIRVTDEDSDEESDTSISVLVLIFGSNYVNVYRRTKTIK